MIIVTGGAGFIGSNFVRHWLDAHDEPVLVLDKLTYAGNLANFKDREHDSRLKFERADICNTDRMKTILADVRPSAILHFAAESHVDRSIHGPSEFVHTNVVGTSSLLEATRAYMRASTPSRLGDFRFLHVSTDEVYGSLDAHDPAFNERTPYAPNSPYAATKAASDHLVRAYHHTFGVPTLTTNCSNNYGPYQFPEKLIPLMVLNALNGDDLPVYGDGSNVRDWLYVTDHCKAIVQVLRRGRIGEVYNIGGRSERKNIDVVKAVCDALDELRPKNSGTYADQIRFVDDRPGHDRRYAIDCTKIEREIGWEPDESFEVGIRSTVRWYVENAEWVAQVRDGRYRDWIDLQYGKEAVA